MSIKVYSYIRFSSPEQAKGHSLERQLNYAKEYAEKHGMVLEESLTMRDEGLSAYHQTHIKRGAFGIFLSAIESGKVPSGSVLIIEALDRISRAEPIEAQAILSQIIMAGITVVTASDGKVYEREIIKKDPMSLVYSLLIFVRANEESATKSRRVKAVAIDRIKQWLDKGHGPIISVGRDPHWVKLTEDKSGFELEPLQAQNMKLLIELYQKGWGQQKLAGYFSSNHPLPGGKLWTLRHVLRFLKKKSLYGSREITISDTTYQIENYYPPLINHQEYLSLQQNIKNRASSKGQMTIPAIMTGMGITFCGYCRGNIITQNITPKKGYTVQNGHRRLYCLSAKLDSGCVLSDLGKTRGRTISSVQVERAILEYCSKNMEISSMLSDDDTKINILKSDLVSLQSKSTETIKQLDQAEKSIINLLSQGEFISPVVNKIVDKLRVQYEEEVKSIEIIEGEILQSSQSKTIDILSEWQSIKEKIYNLDEETRLGVRQVIKKTFKRIDIFFHGMHLSDQNPIKLLKESLGTGDNTIDLILTFHNDKTRILSIDKKTGSWERGADVTFSEALMTQVLVDSQKTEALEHS